MSDNRLQEPIYFQEELVKRYASKRKALVEADVKDLLRCVVEFMVKNRKDNYAFEIPNLATIYDNFDVFDEKDKLYNKKMGEYFCGASQYRRVPLFKKHNKTKEQLQEFQNGIF